MKLKQVIAGVVVSTSLLVACSSTPPTTTVVESPDSWAEADALASLPGMEATAVAGFESAGPASVSGVQVDPAPSPEWEVAEGHVTIVGYDETQ